MAFIYHQVPQAITGATLYPLSELEALAPEVYARQIVKYRDHPSRERIPYQRIPKLDCLRRDVLNFSPLHPHLIYEAWAELGVTLPSLNWYRLSIEAVTHLPTVIYQPDGRPDEDIPEEAVTWLEPAVYREVAALSEETKAWYAKLERRGLRGGWFAHTPHVLMRGAVSVSCAEVINWQDTL